MFTTDPYEEAKPRATISPGRNFRFTEPFSKLRNAVGSREWGASIGAILLALPKPTKMLIAETHGFATWRGLDPPQKLRPRCSGLGYKVLKLGFRVFKHHRVIIL